MRRRRSVRPSGCRGRLRVKCEGPSTSMATRPPPGRTTARSMESDPSSRACSAAASWPSLRRALRTTFWRWDGRASPRRSAQAERHAAHSPGGRHLPPMAMSAWKSMLAWYGRSSPPAALEGRSPTRRMSAALSKCPAAARAHAILQTAPAGPAPAPALPQAARQRAAAALYSSSPVCPRYAAPKATLATSSGLGAGAPPSDRRESRLAAAANASGGGANSAAARARIRRATSCSGSAPTS
mmetsp:Transcript_39572/g.93941  ORF Transcript_39572/g.93941 Transcript_39572/m.93941 type:complete len:241 (+) Transcript_39572:190-912(+)